MKIRPLTLAILTALTGWLFGVTPLRAQVTSSDTTFTPSLLKSGLSTPSGIVSRATTKDLVVTQTGANQVSLVSATSGSTKNFVSQTSANEVAVRASDGVVAVSSHPNGPIDFYTSAGAPVGSPIPAGTPDACIGGLAFDNNGNLFVAAGPAGGIEGPTCSSTDWSIYEFPGPNPWVFGDDTGSPELIVDSELDQIGGLTFAPATPLGTPQGGIAGTGVLYAVSPTSGAVYQIAQFCPDGPNTCDFFSTQFGQVLDESLSPSGIAVDPFTGNIFVSELNGTSVLRFTPPAQDVECCELPSQFASGFTNSYGLTFDGSGNLYVNDTNAGNIWKFTRAAFAAPEQPIILGVTLKFTNPNNAMSDQVQTMFIPQSASLCDSNGRCAAFIQAIFVLIDQNVLNGRLINGSHGDTDFFGGGPIPAGATCVPIPSASPNPSSPTNCLITIQKCYDANNEAFDICPVHVPSGPDRILLTSSYNGPVPSTTGFFAIDFDAPTSDDTATNVTSQPLSGDPSGSGSPKSMCSGTFFYTVPTPAADYSLGPVNPSPIPVPSGGSGPAATVPVTSIDSFSSPVALSVADVPAGVTATLNQPSVTPMPNATDMTTMLSVSVNGSFDSANTIPGIETVIANLLASGCIDNGGIANALTSKLADAQASLNSGKVSTAINTLGAFKSQVQAQAGKHIGSSCMASFTLLVEGMSGDEVQSAAANVSVTGTNAANILINDVSTLITSLAGVNTPDPITGYVMHNGAAVAGGSLGLYNGASLVSTSSMPDVTGFYFFSNTGSLQKGVTYTVKFITFPAPFTTSTPAFQNLTWAGKGLALATFNVN